MSVYIYFWIIIHTWWRLYNATRIFCIVYRNGKVGSTLLWSNADMSCFLNNPIQTVNLCFCSDFRLHSVESISNLRLTYVSAEIFLSGNEHRTVFKKCSSFIFFSYDIHSEEFKMRTQQMRNEPEWVGYLKLHSCSKYASQKN